jgi:hypothetical protein
MTRTAEALARRPLVLIVVIALAMLLIASLAPTTASAQVAPQTVSNRVAVTVSGFAVVKAVAQPTTIARQGANAEVMSAVLVSANMPYQVVARMPVSAAARVWVLNAQNVYERVEAGRSVIVAEKGAPGAMRRNEVRVRVESSNPAIVRAVTATLRYEATTQQPMIAAHESGLVVWGDQE